MYEECLQGYSAEVGTISVCRVIELIIKVLDDKVKGGGVSGEEGVREDGESLALFISGGEVELCVCGCAYECAVTTFIQKVHIYTW